MAINSPSVKPVASGAPKGRVLPAMAVLGLVLAVAHDIKTQMALTEAEGTIAGLRDTQRTLEKEYDKQLKREQKCEAKYREERKNRLDIDMTLRKRTDDLTACEGALEADGKLFREYDEELDGLYERLMQGEACPPQRFIPRNPYADFFHTLFFSPKMPVTCVSGFGGDAWVFNSALTPIELGQSWVFEVDLPLEDRP